MKAYPDVIKVATKLLCGHEKEPQNGLLITKMGHELEMRRDATVLFSKHLRRPILLYEV